MDRFGRLTQVLHPIYDVVWLIKMVNRYLAASGQLYMNTYGYRAYGSRMGEY